MDYPFRHSKWLFNNDLVVLQDTVVSLPDTTGQDAVPEDTLSLSADTITETNAVEQPTQIEDTEAIIITPSIVPAQPYTTEEPLPGNVSPFDTSGVISQSIYELENLSEDNYLNFLKKSEDQYFYVENSARLVYSANSQKNFSTSEQTDHYTLTALKSEQLIKPDWLIGIIIGCLVLFAWLKLFYNKFIDQTFISLWNFQLSENFQRDQSIFSRRVSILLNLNFIITAGLFFYLVAVFFEINPWELSPFLIFIVSTGIVALLLAARYVISHLSGVVFDHHKLYKDYLNQILIIYKNAGIFLIPIVMAIAYLPDKFRIYLIISGLGLLSLGVLFRFVKGFQLIFNKDVSKFYLILYLCTLEFLPALVIYKFFSSLV